MKNVYFIKPVGMDGPIKIGCSDVPERRLATLAAWSPWPLHVIGFVPGDGKDEAFLHHCFFDHHTHHEWFRSSPELRDAIAKVIAAGSVGVLHSIYSPKGNIRTLAQRTRKRTESQKKCFSYGSRVIWTEKRRRKLGEDVAWHAPDDVEAIISRWRGRHGRPGTMPSAAEIARLDEYLADPDAHSVIPRWRRPAVAQEAAA
jgi:hypothetical protein